METEVKTEEKKEFTKTFKSLEEFKEYIKQRELLYAK